MYCMYPYSVANLVQPEQNFFYNYLPARPDLPFFYLVKIVANQSIFILKYLESMSSSTRLVVLMWVELQCSSTSSVR